MEINFKELNTPSFRTKTHLNFKLQKGFSFDKIIFQKNKLLVINFIFISYLIITGNVHIKQNEHIKN